MYIMLNYNEKRPKKAPKYLKKRITRRQALSTGAKIGIAAAVGVVVGFAGGYLSGSALVPPPETVTKTVEKTVTKTAAAATVTKTVTAPGATVTKTVTKTVATPTTPAPMKWPGVKLTIACLASGPKGGISGPMYYFAPKIKELTGIDLSVAEISFADLPVKIMADLSQGTGAYDFFIPCNDLFGELVLNDYIVTIDEYMADPRYPKWDPSAVPSIVADQSRWGGHWYGVPWDSDAWYLFWNMKFLNKWLADKDKRAEFKSKYGYELDPYGWYKRKELTWEKVLDVAEFFTGWDWNEDGEPDYGIIAPLRVGEQGPFWLEAVTAPYIVKYGKMRDRYYNLYWLDPETGEPLVKTEGFKRGVKMFKDLYEKAMPKEATAFTLTDMWDYFLVKQKSIFQFGPPDTFTFIGSPKHGKFRGYLMTSPCPGAEEVWDLKEQRWVKGPNMVGNAIGCSWNIKISYLTKHPDACYWISAWLATPEIHRFTTSNAFGFWGGIDAGFKSDLLTDYGGTATLADYNLPGGFVDPGYPKAFYNEYDLRRAHVGIYNNLFAADALMDHGHFPGAPAFHTIMDTHIVGEYITGACDLDTAVSRTYDDEMKVLRDIGMEKVIDFYQKMIGYGKPNPYVPAEWLWDDRLVPKELIFG